MKEESDGRLLKVLPLILGEHFSITICSLICGASIFASLLYSWMFGIVVIAWFVAGILLTVLIVSPDAKPIDIFFMLKKSTAPEIEKVLFCSVCGDHKCNRHAPEEFSKNQKPWVDIVWPKEIDEAIEKFLNIVLKEYIYNWYREMSTDETFVAELRSVIRHGIAVIYKRMQKVDLFELINSKLLKCGLSHLDCYTQINKFGMSNGEIEKRFFQLLGANIHIACRNRNCELGYLRLLAEEVLKIILPAKSYTCRSTSTFIRELASGSLFLPAMDVLADPDNVNTLLLIFFDEEPMIIYPDSENNVEFLTSFTNTDSSLIHSSALYTNLQLILNDNQLFYSFMTFLKKEGAVNILQFCMSVEDFNKRILGPDWNIQDLNELKKDIRRINNTYCVYDAPERIKFDQNIIDTIAEILNGPVEDMLKFHSSDVMLLAYDQAYHVLETVWCPAFYQSSLYFNFICGNKSLRNQKSPNMQRGNKRDLSVVSKVGNKIRHAFKTSTIDGHMDRWGFENDEPDLAEAVLVDDDLDTTLTSTIVESTSALRDLSAWRLSIPRVESRMDIHNKHYYVFVIEVQRIDIGNMDTKEDDLSWTIERKYPEFYVLEGKLTEFHGELLQDIHLPQKKLFSTKKSLEFMKRNTQPFELFLKKLLVQPSLKGSELLYNFLTSSSEFTEGFLPDIGLSKIIRTVPMKLRKEKGQNLEGFLNAFMNSTEQVKPNQSAPDWKDIFEESAPLASQQLVGSLYGDNAGIELVRELNTVKQRAILKLNGVFDYILYLCSKIFFCPPWFLQILLAVKVIGEPSIQTFYKWYVERKLNQALKPQRIVELVELLTEVLFYNEDPPKTDEEKSKTKEQVYRDARKFLPDILFKLIGRSKVENGIDVIISGLQHPKLNKQLSYALLDIVVCELFPEMTSSISCDSSI